MTLEISADQLLKQIREESTLREPLGDPPQTESVALNAELGGEVNEVVADEVVGAQPSDAAAEPSDLLEDSAWDSLLATDDHGAPTDVAELTAALESSPELRSAALLSALERARTELVRTPTHTLIDTPVQIPIADLIAMTRALMSRLR